MQYNPEFKRTCELYEFFGITSKWAADFISVDAQTHIACVCFYLQELYPEHTENLFEMSGAEAADYLNAVTGLNLAVNTTIDEAFFTYYLVLRRKYLGDLWEDIEGGRNERK